MQIKLGDVIRDDKGREGGTSGHQGRRHHRKRDALLRHIIGQLNELVNVRLQHAPILVRDFHSVSP